MQILGNGTHARVPSIVQRRSTRRRKARVSASAAFSCDGLLALSVPVGTVDDVEIVPQACALSADACYLYVLDAGSRPRVCVFHASSCRHLWSYSLPSWVHPVSMAISDAGFLYVASGCVVDVIDALTGASVYLIYHTNTSFVTVSEGRVYIGCNDYNNRSCVMHIHAETPQSVPISSLFPLETSFNLPMREPASMCWDTCRDPRGGGCLVVDQYGSVASYNHKGERCAQFGDARLLCCRNAMTVSPSGHILSKDYNFITVYNADAEFERWIRYRKEDRNDSACMTASGDGRLFVVRRGRIDVLE